VSISIAVDHRSVTSLEHRLQYSSINHDFRITKPANYKASGRPFVSVFRRRIARDFIIINPRVLRDRFNIEIFETIRSCSRKLNSFALREFLSSVQRFHDVCFMILAILLAMFYVTTPLSLSLSLSFALALSRSRSFLVNPRKFLQVALLSTDNLTVLRCLRDIATGICAKNAKRC